MSEKRSVWEQLHAFGDGIKCCEQKRSPQETGRLGFSNAACFSLWDRTALLFCCPFGEDSLFLNFEGWSDSWSNSTKLPFLTHVHTVLLRRAWLCVPPLSQALPFFLFSCPAQCVFRSQQLVPSLGP